MTREGAVMHSGTRHSSVVSGNVPCIALDSGTGDRYNKSRGGDGRRATHMHTLEYTSDLRKMSDLLCIRQLLSVVRALSQQFRLESLRVFSCCFLEGCNAGGFGGDAFRAESSFDT